MKNAKSKIRDIKNAGYTAITLTLIIIAASLTIVGGLSFFALQEVHAGQSFASSVVAKYAAEGGIEDALYRLAAGRQLESSENLDSGMGTTTITTATVGTDKIVRSAGIYKNTEQNFEIDLDMATTTSVLKYWKEVQ